MARNDNRVGGGGANNARGWEGGKGRKARSSAEARLLRKLQERCWIDVRYPAHNL